MEIKLEDDKIIDLLKTRIYELIKGCINNNYSPDCISAELAEIVKDTLKKYIFSDDFRIIARECVIDFSKNKTQEIIEDTIKSDIKKVVKNMIADGRINAG